MMTRLLSCSCLLALLAFPLSACGPAFQTTKADLAMQSYAAAPGAAALVLERSGRVVLDYTSEIDDAATFKAFGKMSSGSGSGKGGTASARPGTADEANPVESMKRDSGALMGGLGASSYTMEVVARVKILTDEGLARAEIEDILPPDARMESFAAATFLPDGKVIALEEKDVSKADGKLRFKMPGAQVGAVLEYRYKFFSQALNTLTGWSFQSDLPVRSSSFRFKMLSGTNLPFRFIQTADGQQSDPQDKVVLGMDQKQWVELSWELADLAARPVGEARAAVVFGD